MVIVGWKLAAVLRGEAGEALIASYDAERVPAAAENILHSTRSTDFITPKTPAARAYRDAVLELAEHFAFARPLVNSGRLSRPVVLAGSPLNTQDGFEHGPPPGTPAPDAPVAQEGVPGWLLRHLGGGFCLLVFAAPRPLDLPAGVSPLFVTPEPMRGARHDHSGLAAARFGAPVVLLRPDQHVVARFQTLGCRGDRRRPCPRLGEGMMRKLDTAPRLADPDGLLEALLAAHDGLDEAASRRLDARLVLILANHIGDAAVLRQAIALAAKPGPEPGL